MADEGRVPAGIDPTVPNVARMYDYFLRGKDNFASDREAAEKIAKIVPNVRALARDNREFLIRVVRTLAKAGIRQFVDIGAGLPTQQNVHQVALEADPASRIVYIDNDPVVLVHARALLSDNPQTIVLDADVRQPKALIEHPSLRAHIDMDQPVALLLFAIVHFVPDDEEALSIIAQLREPLVSGSYVAISHGYPGEISSDLRQVAQAVYRSTDTGSATARSLEQITRYFDGLELLSPGVVPVEAWRPELEGVEPDLSKPGAIGGVARVP
jgi:hypothetical protein